MNKLFEKYSTKQLRIVGSFVIIAWLLASIAIGYFVIGTDGGILPMSLSVILLVIASAVVRASIAEDAIAAIAIAISVAAGAVFTGIFVAATTATAGTFSALASVAAAAAILGAVITGLYTLAAVFFWCDYLKKLEID